MKRVSVCPLGSECEKIVDDHIEQCIWFVGLSGADPQTGDMIDEQKCAMAWMPIMMVEMANTNRGQTDALLSMRNEQKKGHEQFMSLVTAASRKKLT